MCYVNEAAFDDDDDDDDDDTADVDKAAGAGPQTSPDIIAGMRRAAQWQNDDRFEEEGYCNHSVVNTTRLPAGLSYRELASVSLVCICAVLWG